MLCRTVLIWVCPYAICMCLVVLVEGLDLKWAWDMPSPGVPSGSWYQLVVTTLSVGSWGPRCWCRSPEVISKLILSLLSEYTFLGSSRLCLSEEVPEQEGMKQASSTILSACYGGTGKLLSLRQFSTYRFCMQACWNGCLNPVHRQCWVPADSVLCEWSLLGKGSLHPKEDQHQSKRAGVEDDWCGLGCALEL